MRTLEALPEAKRRRIARETLEIYAPLANRLGIAQLKWELEDLAFRHLEPEAYREIAALLERRRSEREAYVARAIAELERALARAGIRARITGRPKHIYSIWRKMRRKGVGFEQVFDVHALRVLVDDVTACYAALGVVHSLWPPIPGEFDDYIAQPKENLYQSLHTAVVALEGRTLEVQIRTHEMHRYAEYGVAAHWRYKEGVRADPALERKIAWLRQLLEPREGEGGGDFLEAATRSRSSPRARAARAATGSTPSSATCARAARAPRSATGSASRTTRRTWPAGASCSSASCGGSASRSCPGSGSPSASASATWRPCWPPSAAAT